MPSSAGLNEKGDFLYCKMVMGLMRPSFVFGFLNKEILCFFGEDKILSQYEDSENEPVALCEQALVAPAVVASNPPSPSHEASESESESEGGSCFLAAVPSGFCHVGCFAPQVLVGLLSSCSRVLAANRREFWLMWQ
ncbi:hypothetical protein U1Q18_040737 [Sarracenia purpurea var. burkii]